MTLARDHYATLGVAPGATADLIKAAYRKKAAQYHPDKNPSPDAAARFREAQEAYDVLSDAVRRKAYDDYRQSSLIDDPMVVARDISAKYIQEVTH
jgi:curved DNA-binding protein CbpA